MAWLDDKHADTLCALITIGFFANIAADQNDQKKCVAVCYELLDTDNGGPADRKNADTIAAHEAVTRWMKSLKIDVKCNSSVAQADVGLIIAKTKTVLSVNDIRTKIPDIKSYINTITQKANSLDTSAASPPGKDLAPYGAYIGGMTNLDTDQVYILGPSALIQYRPVYRDANNMDALTKVASAYAGAVKHSNSAIGAVKTSTTIPFRMKPNFKDLIQPQPESIEPNKVFGSIHGMINAMITYGFSQERDTIFEIALGKNTSKVCSCFPCTIFMKSVDRPPTATHLGAGDNWNFPQDKVTGLNYRTGYQKWSSQIYAAYDKGVKIVGAFSKDPDIEIIYDNMTKLNGILNAQTANRADMTEVPKVFLEALTFERKFTERLLNAFTNTVAFTPALLPDHK